jgi:hypothetical protein
MTEEELRKECCLKAIEELRKECSLKVVLFSSMLGVDIQDVGMSLMHGDTIFFILKRQSGCDYSIGLSFKRTCPDIKIENIGELYPYTSNLLHIEVPYTISTEKLLEMATEYNIKAVHS